MESHAYAASNFGLNDPEVLRTATEIDPELFAALRIAASSSHDYPIAGADDLVQAIFGSSTQKGRFKSTGVTFEEQDVRERFPEHSFPIVNRVDFVRKAYMAMVLAHQMDSAERLTAAKADGLPVEPSHPLDLEELR
jgi:hypothetical protein